MTSRTLPSSPAPWMRFAAAGTAGFCEMLIFYPLDTAGKRLMCDSARREGTFGTRYELIRRAIFLESRDGLMTAVGVSSPRPLYLRMPSSFSSLFSGFPFALTYKVTQRTYQFGTQPLIKQQLENRVFKISNTFNDNRLTHVLLSGTAGAIMGIGEVMFVPLSVLKIQAQTHPGCFQGKTWLQLFDHCKQAGLWRGWRWMIARNVPGAFALFGGDEISRQFIFPDHQNSILQHFASSFCGAVCSIAVSSPFDVIKTRIQAHKGGFQLDGVQIIRELLSREGWRGLFKGMTPKLLTAAPKTAYGMGLASWLIMGKN